MITSAWIDVLAKPEPWHLVQSVGRRAVSRCGAAAACICLQSTPRTFLSPTREPDPIGLRCHPSPSPCNQHRCVHHAPPPPPLFTLAPSDVPGVRPSDHNQPAADAQGLDNTPAIIGGGLGAAPRRCNRPSSGGWTIISFLIDAPDRALCNRDNYGQNPSRSRDSTPQIDNACRHSSM